VKFLRETEKVDVVIALSHGGLVKGNDGSFTDGEDVDLARDVPGIDIVIGGHSHTEMREAIIVNDRTPWSRREERREPRRTVVTLDGGKLTWSPTSSSRSTTLWPETGPLLTRSRN